MRLKESNQTNKQYRTLLDFQFFEVKGHVYNVESVVLSREVWQTLGHKSCTLPLGSLYWGIDWDIIVIYLRMNSIFGMFMESWILRASCKVSEARFVEFIAYIYI